MNPEAKTKRQFEAFHKTLSSDGYSHSCRQETLKGSMMTTELQEPRKAKVKPGNKVRGREVVKCYVKAGGGGLHTG